MEAGMAKTPGQAVVKEPIDSASEARAIQVIAQFTYWMDVWCPGE